MPEAKHEPEADLPPFQTVNAEELSRNLLRLFEQGGNVLTEFIERNDSKMGPYSAATEITEATNTLSDLGRQWLADPARFAEAQGTLLRSYAELWNNTVRRMFGEEVEPVAEPEPGDSRFKDPEWSANPYFDFWKQAYLVTS
jgi:polyhydroxyalkanoate synthase